jgi:uncharacterized protein (UPF0333 family)
MATVSRKHSASFGSQYTGLSTVQYAYEGTTTWTSTGVTESTVVPGTYVSPSLTYDPTTTTGIAFRVPKSGGGYTYTYEDIRPSTVDLVAITPSVNVVQIAGQTANAAGAVTFPSSVGTSTFSGGSVASVTNPVTVGTNNDKTGYALTSGEHTQIQTDVQTGLTSQGYTTTRAGNLDNLNATVSSRSTFAGGAVASVTGSVGSVTNPVTVGTNNDKTGYALTSGEHTQIQTDAAAGILSAPSNKLATNTDGSINITGSVFSDIAIEPGVNFLQLLRIIGAVYAGNMNEATPGTAVFYAVANSGTARVTSVATSTGRTMTYTPGS